MYKYVQYILKVFIHTDYVSNLYNGIRKHSNVPFQSVCISDTQLKRFSIAYNHYSNIKKHWHKLKFF